MSSLYDHFHPNTPRCNHVFDTNLQCKSPALRGKAFCYWHEQNRKHRDKFTVPLLETEHAIQATLSQVLRELHEGKLDVKRANSMFYGLSLAMYNVRRMSQTTDRDHIIDVPPAMLNMLEPPPNRQAAHATTSADPSLTNASPLVILSEAKDPDAAQLITTADSLSHPNPSATSATSQPPRGTEERSEPPKFPPQPEHPSSSDPQMPPEVARYIKKVLRAGPSHPKFAEVSRLYDRYISVKQAG